MATFSTGCFGDHPVDQRLECTHRDHDAAAESHTRQRALADKLVAVAPRHTEQLPGLLDREREAPRTGLVVEAPGL